VLGPLLVDRSRRLEVHEGLGWITLIDLLERARVDPRDLPELRHVEADPGRRGAYGFREERRLEVDEVALRQDLHLAAAVLAGRTQGVAVVQGHAAFLRLVVELALTGNRQRVRKLVAVDGDREGDLGAGGVLDLLWSGRQQGRGVAHRSGAQAR